MKRKGYKTAPLIRVPKTSVAKLHAAAAAAARDLAAERVAHGHTRSALREAVRWIDLLKDGGKTSWTHGDVKTLERLRALSLF